MHSLHATVSGQHTLHQKLHANICAEALVQGQMAVVAGCRYVLSYMESLGFVKRNQRIMQIGMGGGMKAGVNIWQALRDVQDNHLAWRHLEGRPVTGKPLTLQCFLTWWQRAR